MPVKEHRPSDQELFGTLYDASMEDGDYFAVDMVGAC
jgi:hypothetical protein